MSLAYFGALHRAFLEAEHSAGTVDRDYVIASHAVQLRFAGQAVVPYISPALEHLATGRAPAQALTVCLWDSASTDVEIPPFPWKSNDDVAHKRTEGLSGGTNPSIYFRDDCIHGFYQPGSGTLSMLDTKRNLAVLWVPDARQIPYYESGSPLRAIVHWWAQDHGLQSVHAGAVGMPDGGVLLAGRGGSGKSTTALACLDSDLMYAGDDHVLLGTDSVPRLYSLYNSCKLNPADIGRFPRLAPAVANYDNLGTEKALIFLHGVCPDKVSRGFPIRAVLLPKVSGITRTRLKRASPAAGLRALAPSTIIHLPGAGESELEGMARLVRQVPSYTLELGEDTHRIPDIILGLLSEE